MKIVNITAKDLKEKHSMSEMLIDELASSIGSWTSDDLYENNLDYEFQTEDAAIKEYNFEPDFIASMNKTERKKLTQNMAEYDAKLKAYEESAIEAWRNDHDDTTPLGKEIQRWIDAEHKQMRHEWLYGDYRGNSKGVINELQKAYNAELNYDEKADAMSFEIDKQEWHEKQCGCAEGYPDFTKCEYKEKPNKKALIDIISSNSRHYAEKHKTEMEERKKEAMERAEYKAQQKAADEKERVKKLLQ